MEAWLAKPGAAEADADAEYHEVIEIDLANIKEPLLALPQRSRRREAAQRGGWHKIDEVFIGSCMTNIGHFRAAATLLEDHGEPVPTRLWVAPPTKMDTGSADGRRALQLVCPGRRAHGNAGLFAVHGQPGAGDAELHGGLHLDA